MYRINDTYSKGRPVMNIHDPKSIRIDEEDQPTREDALEAVRILLKWAGEDPSREGLIETPSRVVKAYREWFKGYDEDPIKILSKTFDEVEGYDDLVLLKDIRFESYCEHHLAPIIGKAHIGYLPNQKVVGISKLARTVECFAKRMQVQEKMTAQIANAIEDALNPIGVAVVLEGEHHCMSTRGVRKHGVSMVTKQFRGAFQEDYRMKQDFLNLVGNPISKG